MQNLWPPILELGEDFYDPVAPAQFPQHHLRFQNLKAAKSLGLADLSQDQWLDHFGRFKALPQNLTSPLALRYHGHQFTHYNPDLGDGRGFLFSQHQVGNQLYDLGTKGSGQTPYSRQGDGRLTLKGAVREALATAQLEYLGVNASKTFSIIETGESLHRNDEPSPTRSAVLVRMNHSHIRFGTFQRLAFFKQTENIQKLISYCRRHYFSHLQEGPDLHNLLYTEVVTAHAKTTAQWMMGGFVHGVLNTDNMNITGETFDFGPYRFLPTYDVNFTAAYFDHQGLYRYGRQPVSVVWNLERLAEALSIGFAKNQFDEILKTFSETFHQACLEQFAKRLEIPEAHAAALLPLFFQFLEVSKAPFEQTFFDLRGGYNQEQMQNSPSTSFYQGPVWDQLVSYFTQNQLVRVHQKPQQKCQTLLYPEIETIWKEISEKDDWSLFYRKIADLSL